MFECAGYRGYADVVRRTALGDTEIDKSESMDDLSDASTDSPTSPLPAQPLTYPFDTLPLFPSPPPNPLSSPEQSIVVILEQDSVGSDMSVLTSQPGGNEATAAASMTSEHSRVIVSYHMHSN